MIITFDNFILENWYHGTYNSKEFGLSDKLLTVEYVYDLDGYNKLQEKLQKNRINGDMVKYHQLLDNVSDYIKEFKFTKPLFLSDKYSVAKTYADSERAFDYQNSVEKVYDIDVDCDKIVKIIAIGDRFRFIDIEKVKKGFIDASISEEEIDKLILMFNFHKKNGIKTDTIVAIGNWLGFDCIDIVGVLDSYNGGSVKSNIRIVLNTKKVKINESDEIRKDQRLRFDFISNNGGPSAPGTGTNDKAPFGVDNFDTPEYTDKNQPIVNKKGKKKKIKKHIKPYKVYFKIDQDDYKNNLDAQKGEYRAGPGKAFM